MTDSLSVIVAAYNEAGQLGATIAEVLAAADGLFDGFEVLIIDDASTDGTGQAADDLARDHRRVRAFHSRRNHGLGWVFRAGTRLARMNYVTIINGKHDIAAAELRKIFVSRGRADLVVPYHINRHERPLFRQLVSRTFTTLLNLMLGLRLHYYNDSVLHRRAVLRSLRLRTNSYAYAAETLAKSIRAGCSYVQVPIRNLYPPGAKTKAFRWRNVIGVARSLGSIFRDVYWRGA